MLFYRFMVKKRDQPLEYFYEMGFTLTANPKDDNSWVVIGGVIPDVREALIQGN